jgi:porphobilinogen deaminase
MPEMPGHLRLQACLHSLDGHTALRTTVTAPVASPAQAEHLGQLAVDELVAQGAPALLEQVKLAGPKLY